MIYSTDFVQMAGKLSHVEMVKYMKDLGWTEVITKRQFVRVFQITKDDSLYQADIPTSRGLVDYDSAMYSAVENIARASNKSTEQVLLELLNPLSDIIRIRINEASFESGSIYVEDAIKLYDNAKKLLTATAMDIKHPSVVHLGRPDSAIQEFISNCRFGQTEIGSYIVSLVCPIAEINDDNYKQLNLFGEESEKINSLTRKVTKKLITSIQLVKEAIDKGTFNETICKTYDVAAPISANFLEALSSIGIYKNNTELDISIKWAPTIQTNTAEVDSVSLSHDYFEPIDTLVKEIKGKMAEEKPYVGKISKLHSTTDAETRSEGEVSLVFLNDKNKKTIARILLTKSDYDQAIEAHRKGKYVRVTGRLSGQKSKSIECTGFEVLL